MDTLSRRVQWLIPVLLAVTSCMEGASTAHQKRPLDPPITDDNVKVIRRHNIRAANHKGMRAEAWTTGRVAKFGAVHVGLRITYDEPRKTPPSATVALTLKSTRQKKANPVRIKTTKVNLKPLAADASYLEIDFDGIGKPIGDPRKRVSSPHCWELIMDDPLEMSPFGKGALAPGDYILDLEITTENASFRCGDMRFTVHDFVGPRGDN